MSDLVKRLRIKAGMIEMGELIAWGSDVALMREAADALEMAAPAVQGEAGVKWAPEEVANGNKGIRWVSDEGVHGRPTDHDCRVYLESNPNARGCHCPECTMLYTAPQPDPFRGDNVDLIRSAQSLLSLDDKGAFGPNGIGGHARNIITAFIARISAEQQPAPGVAGLVEALARCRHQASYSIGDNEALSRQLAKVRNIVNEALDARKGGDAP